MAWLKELWRRVQYLANRKRLDDELAEEMRLHLQLRAEEKAADGIAPPDAETQARVRFGNVSQLRESSREVWGWTFWETLAQDVRYALRRLGAAPGFTATAVLSLMLGIGANTAIFSILNAVMLRSLPVEDPRQLVEINSEGGPITTNPIWEQVRDHQQAFSGALAYSSTRFDLTEGGESRYAQGLWVSGDFFHVLGVPAIRGRVLTPSDDRHGGGPSGPVAVISYTFWKTHFAGDPDVVGKAVRLDRHLFTVVGVAPQWFTGLDVDQGFDVAVPIGCEPLLNTDRSALGERSWWWLRMVGRLAPNQTRAQAEARMNSIAPEIARATLPKNWGPDGQKRYLRRSFVLRPAATGFSGTARQYRTALFTLMTVVGLVLIIACANIANLLLARAAARQREISVRLAIGASRLRIIRQLLTESLLLSLAGAASGLLFATWGSRMLIGLLSTTRNEIQLDLSPDLHLLAFTVAVAALTGLLFGLAPAFRATSAGPNQVLKESVRNTVHGSSRFGLGKALVTGQVALSLLLLVGAFAFLGTLYNLVTIDPGFDRHNVLLVQATIPAAEVRKELRADMYDRMLQRLRAIRGVRSASSSMLTPISHFVWNEDTKPEGYQAKPVQDDRLVYFNRISPGYFRTMGTPLLLGRDFSERDTLTSTKVIIVGEAAARHFWGSANPIGKKISTDHEGNTSEEDMFEVIGVVKDAKYEELNEQTLKTAFVPARQDKEPRPGIAFELRSDRPLDLIASAVPAAIAEVNRETSIELRSFESQIQDSLMQPRMVALLSVFFGLLALVLAVTGLYGVISYTATRRRGEIGIRMALGAEYRTVMWLVLRDVAVMLAAGTVLGVAASAAASRLVNSLVYGVRPADPQTLLLAAAVLTAATAIAGYLPARRAARMDPMVALRDE